MNHILWSRNLLKRKKFRTFKTSHSLEEFGGKLYLRKYMYMEYIHISHQFSIMTAPRWTYFTRVLIIPLQLEGTAGGTSHFSKKRGGETWKSSLDPIFQPIGRLNHRVSSMICFTFWRVMGITPSSGNDSTPATRPLWQLPRVLARWLWPPTWLKPVWLEVGDSNKKGQHFILSLRFFFCTQISEFGT